MKNRMIAGFALLSLFVSATLAAAAEGPPKETKPAPKAKTAVAKIEARSGSSASGLATFTEQGGEVTLQVVLHHVPPGQHAVHIHETGDCSDPEGKSAGGHWNPTGSPHGKWGGTCHMGDIGVLDVDAKGEGTLTLKTPLWSVGGKPASDVVGKAVIVHEKTDDFTTQPTGNAGARIGCGVIELAK